MRESHIRPVSWPELSSFLKKHLFLAFQDLRIRDDELAEYVTSVLVKFARTDELYPWGRISQARMETVVEMLVELDESLTHEASLVGPERERSLRQHIGDYSLFMSGIFRVYIEKRGILDFYLSEGTRAYRKTAQLQRRLYQPGAGRFEMLADEFERISGALDYMRKVYLASSDRSPSGATGGGARRPS